MGEFNEFLESMGLQGEDQRGRNKFAEWLKSEDDFDTCVEKTKANGHDYDLEANDSAHISEHNILCCAICKESNVGIMSKKKCKKTRTTNSNKGINK